MGPWGLLILLLLSLSAVSSTSSSYPAVLSISTVTSGQNGFLIEQGTTTSDNTGYTVARGDLNGDGYEDLLIGAPHYTDLSTLYSDAGRVYVIFGSSTPHGNINLTSPSVLSFVGTATDASLGYALAAGDVNGDGVSDAVLCYPGTSPAVCAVVFGNKVISHIETNLNALNGTNGFNIIGETVVGGTANALPFWGSTATVGDLNGDGYGDVCIAAVPDFPNAGSVSCFFGRSSFTTNLNLNSLDGTQGFLVSGTTDDHLGYSMSIGDINGDSCNDLIIGANTYTSYTRSTLGQTGGVFVILGKCKGKMFSATISANGTIPIGEGFVIEGQYTNEEFGYAVMGADVNGDGISDLIVTAPYSTGQNGNLFRAGTVAVFFGGEVDGLYPSNSGMLATRFPTYGLLIYGSQRSQYLGFSLSAGDINGDGISDIATGSNLASSQEGFVLVFYGACTFNKTIWLVSDISGGDGANGFVVEETSHGGIGYSVEVVNLFNHSSKDLFIGTTNGNTTFYLYGETSTKTTSCPAHIPVLYNVSITPFPSTTSHKSPSPSVTPSQSSSPSPSRSPSVPPAHSHSPTPSPSHSQTPSASLSSHSPSASPSASLSHSPSASSHSPSPVFSVLSSPSPYTQSPSASSSTSPTASPTQSSSPMAAPLLELFNHVPRLDDIAHQGRPQPYFAEIPAGVGSFNVTLDVLLGGAPLCLYARKGALPTTTIYDYVQCTLALILDVQTENLKRQADPCVPVTYYFLLEGSATYNIELQYDAGCDGCGGYSDSCGCHTAGSISNCSCPQTDYRGYSATAVDRGLLLAEILLLQQSLEQAHWLAQKVQDQLIIRNQLEASEQEFSDIISETYYFQSQLNDFNPYLEDVISELQSK